MGLSLMRVLHTGKGYAGKQHRLNHPAKRCSCLPVVCISHKQLKRADVYLNVACRSMLALGSLLGATSGA